MIMGRNIRVRAEQFLPRKLNLASHLGKETVAATTATTAHVHDRKIR